MCAQCAPYNSEHRHERIFFARHGPSRQHPHHREIIQSSEICLWEMSRNLTFIHSKTRNENARVGIVCECVSDRGRVKETGTWDGFPQPYECLCLMVRWLSHVVALSPTFLRHCSLFTIILTLSLSLRLPLHLPLYTAPLLYMKSDYPEYLNSLYYLVFLTSLSLMFV